MTNTAERRNFTIDDLIGMIKEVDSDMAELKKKKVNLENELLNDYLSSEISEQLKDKDYGCGTATVNTEKYVVKGVVSKKIVWDNSQLSNIATKIVESGQNLEDYIDIKYSVSENKFKAWPEFLKKEFVDARTVEPSKPKLKLEERK